MKLSLSNWKRAKEKELAQWHEGAKLIPAKSKRRIKPLKEQLVIWAGEPKEVEAPNGKKYWILQKYQAPTTRQKPSEPVSPQVRALIERLGGKLL